MDRPGKEILIGRFSGERRLAQVVVKIKDIKGSMSNVLSMMAREGVDIRQSVAYAVSQPEKCAIYNAFIDLKKSKVQLEGLVKKLKGSNYVLDAWASEGVEGAIVDTLAFPLTWSGQRMVFLRQEDLTGMFREIERVFGSGGTMIIHRQGRAYGESMADELVKTLGVEYVKRNFNYGLMLMEAGGWGIPEVLKASPDFGGGVVAVQDCFDCSATSSKLPSSHFMRGFLAGLFSRLAGFEVLCEEVKCAAAGDQRCEFVLHRSEVLPAQ